MSGTPTLPGVLHQAERWVNGQRLEDMDRHHRANLIPFLRRNALMLYAVHVARGGHYDQHDERSVVAIAEDWLAQTPLVRRLVELEAGRPIEERRETFERNRRYEAETGYRKARLVPVPASLPDEPFDDGFDG